MKISETHMLQNYCTKDIIEKSSYLDFLVLIYICDFWKNNFNFWWHYLWHLESEGGTEITEISNNAFKVCSINFLRWLKLKGKLDSFCIFYCLSKHCTSHLSTCSHCSYWLFHNLWQLFECVSSPMDSNIPEGKNLAYSSLFGQQCFVFTRKVNSWRRFLSLHSASTGFSTQSDFTDLIACHQFPDCLSSPTLYFWTPLDHHCLYLYYRFCSWKISSLYLIIFSYYFGWVRFN